MIKGNFFRNVFMVTGCFLLLQQASLAFSRKRIINGKPTIVDKIPFIMQIYKSGKFVCGGALLSDKYVLTAAHCVKPAISEQFIIVGDSTEKVFKGIKNKNIAIKSNVSKIIVPPGFSRADYYMDIALLKLETPFKSIPKAEMCDADWIVGDEVKIYGWGRTKEEIDYLPNQLRFATVKGIAHAECVESYKEKLNISDSMMCADTSVSDACVGDSGGPALFKGKLCGVISFGIGCGRGIHPAIYTSVNYAKKFIKDGMASD